MAKKIPLTRKRRQWAEPRQATIKGSPLLNPAATAAKYSADLERMVAVMRKEYQREIEKLLGNLGHQIPDVVQDASLVSQARILFSWLGQKYSRLFASRASAITERMINGASKANKRQLGDSLKKISGGLTIPVPDMTATLAEKLKASTVENVNLITNISEQYAERISGAVMRSIQSGGNGAADILEEVREIGGMSERRAQTIARDQTAKVTSALNVERSKAAGIKKWEWVHSGGGASPRKRHLELDGKVFSYDDPPPIIDENGTRGYPGFLPRCRCVQAPVLSFGDD